MSALGPHLTNSGLDNDGNPIVNVADPVNPQDAATRAFSSNASNLTSGTLPAARLPFSGVTAGTYNSVTVDTYGRIISATNVSGGTGGAGGFDFTTLSTLPAFDGTELLPFYKNGTTYSQSVANLGAYLVLSQGINIPPTSTPQAVTMLDVDVQTTGNLLIGASDRNGDTLSISSLSYKGVLRDMSAGSFQTDYGIFYCSPVDFSWSYTTSGPARALNTGQTAHEVFTYTVSDGRGGISTQTLTVTITGTNSIPIVNSVNGKTPMNTPVTGSVIFNYAFDYETTPTVASFTVQGMTGNQTLGSPVTLAGGAGTITLSADGSYTFTPAQDYFGPVPRINYVITDGVNNVTAFLTLAVTPFTGGTVPVVLFTDIVSGPITGGEGNNGCYLTLWGLRLGNSAGLGTTTKVFIGGQEVSGYRELITDQLAQRFPGLQRLTVQVGAIGNPTLGVPQQITAQVSSQTSNAGNIFIPNPGRILFVDNVNGNDTTAVPGDINHPYRMLQYPNRGQRSVYTDMLPGDHIVLRGGNWSDLGYDTSWFRFRDPAQQGSSPTGQANTGYFSFMPYPGETVHYSTPVGGNKGGFQGPSSAFSGTCGDWVTISKFVMDVPGGSTRDAAPVNMQYNTGHWRIVGNNLGPWVAGDSATLNAACITGEGNFIFILGNYCHDVEGTIALQNHGLYAGTSSYGWEVAFNWFQNMTGGSHIQFNDSDGGTGTFTTPYGTWEGFTNNSIHHNYLEVSAKYGINFADVGAGQGDLSFVAFNNVIVGTGLSPLRNNTTTATSKVVYAFNTMYDCVRTNSGGNGYVRNEGAQGSPGHHVMVYNNIFAFGPNTVAGCTWFSDSSGDSSGYDFQRNLYWGGTQNPGTMTSDPMGVYGDPLFVNAAGGDFRLQTNSPAINTGTKSLSGTGLSVQDDITGVNTRQYGGAPDIGAYEYPVTTPYATVQPSASGGPQVAVPTNVAVGSWANSPTSYSRQFRVGGVNVGAAITGTGTASYTPVGADSGKLLDCVVTVSNGDGTNGTGTTVVIVTVGTIAVGVGAPAATTQPSISGTTQMGNQLTGNIGVWTGSPDSYTYQWLRNGTAITLNGTALTYTLVQADVGATITFKVTAVKSTTGNVSATSAGVGPISPANADPQVAQTVNGVLPTTGNQAFTLGSNVSAGNYIVFWQAIWDNAIYNASLSDTQGNTMSNFTQGQLTHVQSNNPWAGFIWAKLGASGAYTANLNTNGSVGGAAIMIEVSGCDPTTLMDIAQDVATNTGTTAQLTSTAATTKPTDLILIGLTTTGVGHVISGVDSAQWSLVDHVEGTYESLWLYKKKEVAVETFTFSATIDTSVGWAVHSLVVKGS